VERVDQPCPPGRYRPTSSRDPRRPVVAKTASDATGHYTISLALGDYVLSVVNSRFSRCTSAIIVVRSGEPTHADIKCDTGIR